MKVNKGREGVLLHDVEGWSVDQSEKVALEKGCKVHYVDAHGGSHDKVVVRYRKEDGLFSYFHVRRSAIAPSMYLYRINNEKNAENQERMQVVSKMVKQARTAIEAKYVKKSEENEGWSDKAIEGSFVDPNEIPSQFTVQYGGDHYSQRGIQPLQYILANDLDFCEANVVKYITRHTDKNGAEDIKKVVHYAQFILEDTYGIRSRIEYSNPTVQK